MKLLPMHYSATCGGSAAASQAGGFPWDRSPCRAPGEPWGCRWQQRLRDGRLGQSWCQGLPGRWRGRRMELGKAMGRGRVLTPGWGWEENIREDPSCRQEEWDREKGRGEESSLHWCVLDCPVWTVQIPPVLCSYQSLSWPMYKAAVVCSALGALLPPQVQRDLSPAQGDRSCPCKGTGGDSGGGAANHLSCCFALIVAKWLFSPVLIIVPNWIHRC